MADFVTPDPNFADRVRNSIENQAFLNTLKAQLHHVGPGEVDIALPNTPALGQQYGLVHGGVLTAIADAAALSNTLVPQRMRPVAQC